MKTALEMIRAFLAGMLLALTIVALGAVALIMARSAHGDEPLPCPIYTNPVPTLEAWTYFEHPAVLVPYEFEDAGRLWFDYGQTGMASGFYHMESEGHPVAVRWRAGAVEHVCGEIPPQIFWDNFELGSLARWPVTQGE